MITPVFNALKVCLNKHLMYPDLFTRSSVHVVSGCLEVATAVKARAWREPSLYLLLILVLKKAAFLLLSLFSNQEQLSYWGSHPTVELFSLFHNYSLSSLFSGHFLPCTIGSVSSGLSVRHLNRGLRRSINNHLCAGDTCRSFYCGAEGDASSTAGLHASPAGSIIKDTPATELVKKHAPQLLLAWPCLF